MVSHIAIINLTEDVISCRVGSASHSIVLPSSSTSVELLRGVFGTIALRRAKESDEDAVVSVKATTGFSWKVNKVSEDCPWRIYRVKVSSTQHKLVVFPRRNMAAFLSEMPDKLRLSSLLLPGTHDSLALYGWPISQCQNLLATLPVQLSLGIRVLDVRLSVIRGKLMAYHGIYPQRRTFAEILESVHGFLASPESSRETVVMSIKQEDFALTSSALFSRLVREEILSGPGGLGNWFLENRIPTLGEVRGKIVLFSRFGNVDDGAGWEGGLDGMGIHPTTWPDSQKSGFTWNCKDTLVRTQDWYAIPSFLEIPEKAKLATEILLPPPIEPPMPVLSISFLSAASFPLATPPLVARGFGFPRFNMGVEGVNNRVGRWLLDQLSATEGHVVSFADNESQALLDEKTKNLEEARIRGWVLMDFCMDPGSSVVPLLAECNFRGRTGERW